MKARVVVEIELTQGDEVVEPIADDARHVVQDALRTLFREGRSEDMPNFDWDTFTVISSTEVP